MLRGVALLLVLWLVASVLTLVQARSSAVSGLDRLDSVRQELTAAELLRGGGQEELAAAQRDFEQAHDRVNSVVLTPWKVIPLVGGNVRSAERITAAASRVADVAGRAAEETSALLESSPTTGAERLALLAGQEHPDPPPLHRFEHLVARCPPEGDRLPTFFSP